MDECTTSKAYENNTDQDSPNSKQLVNIKRKSSVDVSSLSSDGKRQKDKDGMDIYSSDEEFMDDSTSDDNQIISPWIDQFQTMSRACQKSALFALVSNLGLQHVRQLRHIIEPHFQKDFLAMLPRELSHMIIENLSPTDLIRAGDVSRAWRVICENELVWKKICLARGLPAHMLQDEPSLRINGAWEGTAMSASQIVVDHLAGTSLHRNREERSVKYGPIYNRSQWKSLFMRNSNVTDNWRNKSIHGSCVLRGHEEHVITCLQVQEDIIVTGSDDNTLKVWSISKGCLLHTLIGHTGGVWTSQISSDGKYIVSGSTDRTVKVWSVKGGLLLNSLIGHTSTVRCMSLYGHILVSGSRDSTLRLWCLDRGVCLQQFIGHQAAVRCVQFDGRRVVSGAYDFNIKVWDATDGKCICTLMGHSNRVYSLLLDSERDLVVSGSLDTTIRVWDIITGRCLSVLLGHTSLTSGMQLRGNILVSCNADSTVRVWDIRDGHCLNRLHGQNGHSSAITSLQYLDNGLVASSSDDGTVKLWDVEKGQFIRDLIRLKSGGSGGCIWRIKASGNLLVCAVGSRNGTEDTKLILLDFDASFP